MRAPDFNWSEAKWDEFGKFHNNVEYNLFVKFDDGGFMIRNNNLKPDRRKTYNEYGFTIMRSDDPVCKGYRFLTPDGERVTAKSLSNCELLWDHDTNKAYSLDIMWYNRVVHPRTNQMETPVGPSKLDMLPTYLSGGKHNLRFFMYADKRIVSMPVAFYKIREYDDERREYIKQTYNACKAWHAMVETKENKWRFSSYSPDMLAWRSFKDLTEFERRGVAIYNFRHPVDQNTTSYLIMEKKARSIDAT